MARAIGSIWSNTFYIFTQNSPETIRWVGFPSYSPTSEAGQRRSWNYQQPISSSYTQIPEWEEI